MNHGILKKNNFVIYGAGRRLYSPAAFGLTRS